MFYHWLMLYSLSIIEHTTSLNSTQFVLNALQSKTLLVEPNLKLNYIDRNRHLHVCRVTFFISYSPKNLEPSVGRSLSSEPSEIHLILIAMSLRRANCSELMQNRCATRLRAAGFRNLRNGEPQIDPRAYVSEGIIIEEGRATPILPGVVNSWRSSRPR